ncbi:hypothetical protein [Streptomyces sp. AN091965]|uniref:hypothetical protein n=1 Tax=Streptomyces sp. AN091965 TaxID=2927803 RepID=UPI001F605E91|nr:hypothetical protein [Streptomyces sp. AN091965]MCI3930189.1 hypothetical protein [Streptomyces sp. AN091965]
MITFDADTGSAQKAVKAARRRKLPVPAEIDATAAMVDVALKAAHMQPPERPTRDDVPATAQELAALIEERAHAHRIALAHQAVGTDFLEPIARKYNALVRDRVPGWIMALQPEFNGLIKQLRIQSRKLPDSLDRNHLNWNDPAVTAPWEKAEGIAFQLDQIVHDRQDMARAGGLAGEGGQDSALYAVAKLPKPSTEAVVQHVMRTHVSPEMQQWRELRHQPVSRWLQLVRSEHLTIELATPDEVRERAALRDKWVEAIALRGVAPVPSQKAIKAIESALQG